MLDTDREPTVATVGETVAPVSPIPTYVEVPCTCPQAHGTDTVYLTPKLTTPMGMALATAIGNEPIDTSVVEATLVATFVAPPPAGGVIRWTKTDAADDVEPITRESIARLLPFGTGGIEVAERATELYTEDYLRPLLRRLGLSLPPTPMDGSTSPTKDSGKKRRKHSARSSLNGSAGKL